MLTFSKALVTGASSGIGEALCHLLASKGIALIITGRNGERLEALKDQLTVPVTCFTADLSTKEGRSKTIEHIHAQTPDLVVNNAGFGLYGEALSHSTAKQVEIVDVNVTAYLEIMLEAARTLTANRKKGVILNVSSSAAFEVFPSLAVYAASKAFINSCSQAFDFEMAPLGVRVLAACPGMVNTSFSERASSSQSKVNVDPLSMTPEFAAEEIWWQIQSQNPLHIFNWKYRLAVMFGSLFPTRWVASILKKRIDERLK